MVGGSCSSGWRRARLVHVQGSARLPPRERHAPPSPTPAAVPVAAPAPPPSPRRARAAPARPAPAAAPAPWRRAPVAAPAPLLRRRRFRRPRRRPLRAPRARRCGAGSAAVPPRPRPRRSGRARVQPSRGRRSRGAPAKAVTPSPQPRKRRASYERSIADANRALENGQTAKAQKLYDDALRMQPNGVAAITGSAYVLLDKRRPSPPSASSSRPSQRASLRARAVRSRRGVSRSGRRRAGHRRLQAIPRSVPDGCRRARGAPANQGARRRRRVAAQPGTVGRRPPERAQRGAARAAPRAHAVATAILRRLASSPTATSSLTLRN